MILLDLRMHWTGVDHLIVMSPARAQLFTCGRDEHVL
jgi:hypothetical protein